MGYVLLQKGTQGVAVTNMQTRLVGLGYYQVMPDGIYGDKDVVDRIILAWVLVAIRKHFSDWVGRLST